jgi:hypothetical protein
MADQNAPAGGVQPNWPNWVKTMLKWLGIAAALVGAVALVITGVGNVWNGTATLCKDIGLCSRSDTPAPNPKSPTGSGITNVAAPILQSFDSEWVDGGHTADEYCNPRKAAYEQQYPSYTIVMTKLPDETHKDVLGHVTYRFQCNFVAQPK